MPLFIFERADLLKTLMTLDREEIRGIRSMIYNATGVLATASFAITSFLFGQKGKVPQASLLCVVTDCLIILLLWVFFLRLKRDLYWCRQCLEGRENLIKGLGTAKEQEDLNPFPDMSHIKPKITDSELRWLPILATAAIAVKSLLIWLQFLKTNV